MPFFKKKEVKMIDMHCHVIPAVDDGSSGMEETVKMLKIASDNGIHHMIVTPHYKNGRRNASCETIRERITQVEQEMAKHGITVSLYPGNELYYFTGAEEALEKEQLFTLNETNRVLVEFSPHEAFTYIRNALESLSMAGYVPVIAHIERYACFVQQFSYVEEIIQLGVEIQVNIPSIFGKLGSQVKAFTKELLKKQYIDYLGTDAHDCKSRTPEVADFVRQLYKKYDPDYVDRIVYANALELINAE